MSTGGDQLPADLIPQLEKTAVEDVDTPGLQDAKEIETKTSGDDIYTSAKTFEELGISRELLKGIYVEMGYEHPSKIQATTLPMILTPPFKDLVAQAHNGSGKTTCFVLAMLSRVDVALKKTQAICVCPTRELVVQNMDVLKRMGKFTEITSTSTATEDITRKTVFTEQVIIGTHGKLKSWSEKRLLFFENIKILVFDEADNMLDAGASGSIGQADDSVRLTQRIKSANRKGYVQVLLFSATFNEDVKKFTERLCPKANRVFVPKEELSLDVIAQYNVRCPSEEDKINVLKNDIFPNIDNLGQTIIFVRRRFTAGALHRALEAEKYTCTSLTGELPPDQRDKIVREFREGKTKILIATDVLSRGFDVSQITLVINFDLPTDRMGGAAMETYLHRIGRSGRFGRKGVAFNFLVDEKDAGIMQAISSYYGKKIEEVAWNNEDRFEEILKAYNK